MLHNRVSLLKLHLFIVVLVSSVGWGSDYESVQLINCIVLIVRVRVRPVAKCAKITYSMRVRIALARVAPNAGCKKPFDPRESR